MSAIEILVIVFSVLIVALVFGRYIYKKIKGIPTDTECESCSSKRKVNKMLNSIRKELDEEKCHCNSQ